MNSDQQVGRHSLKDVARRTEDTLSCKGAHYRFHHLRKAGAEGACAGLAQLPFSLRVIAENLICHADDPNIDEGVLAALARGEHSFKIPFYPARWR